MITLEQVEKLRERANVSYDEAKTALEAANGDVLEALIQLEKKGIVAPPAGGGFYSSEKSAPKEEEPAPGKKGKGNPRPTREGGENLFRKLMRFLGEILHRGNINHIQVTKDGEIKTSVSITILALMILIFFWITVPLLVIGLFCGFRYVFTGPDFGKESVNNAMDAAAKTAESIKRSVMEGEEASKE